MRRSLAAALLGISLWTGSLAWSAFVMTHTVLDPDRSEHVADALLEDDAVRDRMASNIAGGVEAALPPGTPVDRAALDAGAQAALASPEVEALVRDAMVQTHRAFVGEGEVPGSIDGVVPGAPAVEVPLPTERVPDLGPVRRALLAAAPVLALLAAAGTVLALVVTDDRRGVVRRAGRWAVGLSAVVLLVAYGVPALVREVAPDQAEVVAALVGALAATTRGPAMVLGAAGVAGLLLSLVWRPARAAEVPRRRWRAVARDRSRWAPAGRRELATCSATDRLRPRPPAARAGSGPGSR